MKRKLTRSSLFRSLEKVCNTISEHRNSNAPNYKYPITSAAMTAFAAFYFQRSSLRSHEQVLDQATYRHNFKNLFHREPIRNSQTLRNILDPIEHTSFIPAFDDVFRKLDRSGMFQELSFNPSVGLLFSGDGVDYFSSEEISCNNCSCAHFSKENGEKRTLYSHKMFNVGIVHPSENMFIPLGPEFITPQDGKAKQDCEQAAAKRWLTSFRERHKTVRATIQVDALHCNHDFLSMVKANRFHFIATCKPGNCKTMYEWIETARRGNDIHKIEETTLTKGKKQRVIYEYLNDVPIRDTDDSLRVNYISIKEIDPKSGKKIRQFDYVTDICVKDKNVKALCIAGRKRWKVENEGHNTLKNQGYYFDHNYGHGKQNLSANIAMLILYSFLVHIILRLVAQDGLANVYKNSHARRKCIELLRNMTEILKVQAWEELYSNAMKALEKS